jgi:peptidoglycan/LPS O-acetylase OafA/YrhL
MNAGFSTWLEKFRRITSGGIYFPEIDGLRFIAIFWVVAWMHTSNFIHVKVFDSTLFSPVLSRMVLEGGYGVSLFFMISGFILGLPFARNYLLGSHPVSLKSYYLRRLTRLEPPYLAALIFAFAGLVFILKKYSFSDLFPHLAASAVYAHGFIFHGEKSRVLGIAWSLEVEVQFYILVPLLSFLYRIKRNRVRWIIFSLLILLFTGHAYFNAAAGSYGLQYALHCFLIGMLICDLYLNKVKPGRHSMFWYISGVLLLLFLPLFISLYDFPSYLVKHLLVGWLLYVGLFNEKMKKLLSVQWISIIGGMCYSIYLIHFMVMTALLPFLKKIHVDNRYLQFSLYSIILILAVLVAGAIFYRLVEQPCMHKDWYKRTKK